MGIRVFQGLTVTLLLAVVAPSTVSGANRGKPISCALAERLARSAARPVWFPSRQPQGRLVVNANVPIFGPGLEWASGQRYFFLYRLPRGGNLGEPFPTKVTSPYLTNFGHKLPVLRLARVEGRRLYAEWPTLARYPDLTAADITVAVAKGESVSRFVAFLGSLHHIVWPECRTG